MRVLVLTFCLFVVCEYCNSTTDPNSRGRTFGKRPHYRLVVDPPIRFSESCLKRWTYSRYCLESNLDCMAAATGTALIHSDEDVSKASSHVLEQELKCPFYILARECLVKLVTEMCGPEIEERARVEVSKELQEDYPSLAECTGDDTIGNVSQEIYEENRKLLSIFQSLRQPLPSVPSEPSVFESKGSSESDYDYPWHEDPPGIYISRDEPDASASEMCWLELKHSISFMEINLDCMVAATGAIGIHNDKDLSNVTLLELEQELKCPFFVVARECVAKYTTELCGEEVEKKARLKASTKLQEDYPLLAKCTRYEDTGNVSKEIYDENRKLLLIFQSLRGRTLPSISEHKRRSRI